MKKLTPAQIEVVKRKALGETDTEAAKSLHISPIAVKRRRERALYDLGAKNIAHAVYIAVGAGII